MVKVYNVNSGSENPIEAALSNLSDHTFKIGKLTLIVEVALQMIKFPLESKERKEILALSGKDIGIRAKRLGKNAVGELVYWDGRTIVYNSQEHRELLKMFIEAKFHQNEDAMKALLSTIDGELDHDVGPESPNTSLPKDAFLKILIGIRNERLALLINNMGLKQEFRFNGPVPCGKFEYTCCGQQVFDQEISGDKETEKYKCAECGTEFIIRKQKDHWHLSIVRK
ncbi:hypothetical protein KAT63_02750 [Candidatus Parcubacteria bacterium]|nr:hypothetical protein [Candidatus Parcubacteria bacterium]